MSRDGSLKDKFDADKLPQFWLFVKNDSPSLPDKAKKKKKVLLSLVAIYLCENGFSAVTVMKTTYRSRSVIEKGLGLLPRPERLWGTLSPLSNGYQGFFPRG
jgi:hypothetical protein